MAAATNENDTLHEIILRKEITMDNSQYNQLGIVDAAMNLSKFRHSYEVSLQDYEIEIEAANILVQLKNSYDGYENIKQEMLNNDSVTIIDNISCRQEGGTNPLPMGQTKRKRDSMNGEETQNETKSDSMNVYNMRNISIYLALLILSAVTFYVGLQHTGIFTRIENVFNITHDELVKISSKEAFKEIVEKLNAVLDASTSRFLSELSQITSELILYISGRGQNLPQLNALSLYTWLAVCGRAWNDLKKILVPVWTNTAGGINTAASYLYSGGLNSIESHLKLIDDIFQRRKRSRRGPPPGAAAATAAAAAAATAAAAPPPPPPPLQGATANNTNTMETEGGRRTRRRQRRKKSRKQKRRRSKGSKRKGSRLRKKRKSHYRRAQ